VSFLICHISDITRRASVEFCPHKIQERKKGRKKGRKKERKKERFVYATKSISIDIGHCKFYLMLR
jgi:hypothetical protein